MNYEISNVADDDLPAVLALNGAAVPHVNRVSIEQIHWFADHALYFRVAGDETEIAAFLIGFGPGSDYQSPNYRWFCDHYPSFVYVDRVVVAPTARNAGLASRLYEDFATKNRDVANVMTCEVNIRPANDTSMRFHLRRGFRQVGSQLTDGGAKEVALLEKEL